MPCHHLPILALACVFCSLLEAGTALDGAWPRKYYDDGSSSHTPEVVSPPFTTLWTKDFDRITYHIADRERVYITEKMGWYDKRVIALNSADGSQAWAGLPAKEPRPNEPILLNIAGRDIIFWPAYYAGDRGSDPITGASLHSIPNTGHSTVGIQVFSDGTKLSFGRDGGYFAARNTKVAGGVWQNGATIVSATYTNIFNGAQNVMPHLPIKVRNVILVVDVNGTLWGIDRNRTGGAYTVWSNATLNLCPVIDETGRHFAGPDGVAQDSFPCLVADLVSDGAKVFALAIDNYNSATDTGDGKLKAIHPLTGRMLWAVDVPGVTLHAGIFPAGQADPAGYASYRSRPYYYDIWRHQGGWHKRDWWVTGDGVAGVGCPGYYWATDNRCAISCDDRSVYVLTPSGLFSFDVNGNPGWSNMTLEPAYNSKPAISGDLIYVAEMSGVRAFNRRTGVETWQFTGSQAAPAAGYERFWTSPIIVRGMIYLAEVTWHANREIQFPKGTPIGRKHTWIDMDYVDPRLRLYALKVVR